MSSYKTHLLVLAKEMGVRMGESGVGGSYVRLANLDPEVREDILGDMTCEELKEVEAWSSLRGSQCLPGLLRICTHNNVGSRSRGLSPGPP